MPKDRTEAWERQKGESAKAFTAFCVYRNMGPERSVKGVQSEYKASTSLLYRWSSQWNWAERVRLYENHLDRISVEKRKRRRREAREMHDKMANAFLGKVAQRLKNMSDSDLDKASLWTIAQVFKIAQEVQEVALGPTQEELFDMEQSAKQVETVEDLGEMIEMAFQYDAARENDGEAITKDAT
ncbi:MAG: hypothetical protein NC311_10610 [Muribaculaceae bacterium]|nr:hypothetical protein [Muribaculaceae bacterium]